uniref:Lipocalin/cytosolic fatty-acid binding domain-containing protein n=1 Tax=Sus scrofa TaxID=9823 RepID=A0A8D1PDK8_PIG
MGRGLWTRAETIVGCGLNKQKVIAVNVRGPVTACHVARNLSRQGTKGPPTRALDVCPRCRQASRSRPSLTMSLLLLAVGLTLLSSTQARHWGPQDPNFNETLVGGNWFSAAMASNQPQLMKAAGARRILIHHIQVTPRALRFHLHQRINGVCVPTVMTANKTKKKFQYLLEYVGQNRVFLEKVDPKSYAIICTHHKARGREMVVVTLLSRTPEVSQDTLRMFLSYCRKHGLHEPSVIDLTRTDRCLHARQ